MQVHHTTCLLGQCLSQSSQAENSPRRAARNALFNLFSLPAKMIPRSSIAVDTLLTASLSVLAPFCSIASRIFVSDSLPTVALHVHNSTATWIKSSTHGVEMYR